MLRLYSVPVPAMYTTSLYGTRALYKYTYSHTVSTNQSTIHIQSYSVDQSEHYTHSVIQCRPITRAGVAEEPPTFWALLDDGPYVCEQKRGGLYDGDDDKHPPHPVPGVGAGGKLRYKQSRVRVESTVYPFSAIKL